jgi:hypothetical protein
MTEAQYRESLVALEQARFEDSLGAGRLSNIGIVQSPAPPVRDAQNTMKITAGICYSGIIFGLVLAFLLELRRAMTPDTAVPPK